MPRATAINFLKKNEGWIRCLLTVLVIVALHFFDDRYVSKASYSEDQRATSSALTIMRDSLNAVRESVMLLGENRRLLDDHEARLRHLERR